MISMPISDTQQQIVQVCDSVKKLLLSKNRKYGDSALNPTRIFSKAGATEQLLVRIDDKLSRISKGVGLVENDEDVITDLIGYLVLLKISTRRDNGKSWDGTDIDSFSPDPLNTNLCNWEHNGDNSRKLNDPEWVKLHTTGDRFA